MGDKGECIDGEKGTTERCKMGSCLLSYTVVGMGPDERPDTTIKRNCQDNVRDGNRTESRPDTCVCPPTYSDTFNPKKGCTCIHVTTCKKNLCNGPKDSAGTQMSSFFSLIVFFPGIHFFLN